MSEKLKPCPFCGRTSAVIIHSGKYVTVTCSFSYRGCGASTACKLTKDDAIEAWNTRADTQEAQS